MFVFPEVIGDSKHRESDPAAVPVMRIKVDEVIVVGQGVGLDANHAKMLPLTEVILVGFTPAPNAGGQRFATDLDRQELLLGAEGGAADKAVLERIKSGREKVVQNQTLCGRAGVPIKDRCLGKSRRRGQTFSS